MIRSIALIVVFGRNEPGLECARRQVHAGFEHGVEERVVAAGCRGLDIGVVVHALLRGAKRDREEVTGALDGVVHTGGVERPVRACCSWALRESRCA